MVRACSLAVFVLGLCLCCYDVSADEFVSAKAQILPQAKNSLLLGATRNSIGEVVLVGERGHILVVDQSGEEFKQSPNPIDSTLTSVTCLKSSLCWSVGHDSAIIKSIDDGKSWKVQNFSPGDFAPLFDVWFKDSDFGVAVGAYGLYLETRDGGNTWIRKNVSEDEEHFYSLFTAASGQLFIVGEFGLVLQSVDEGLTWEKLETPYSGSFFGGLGLPSDNGILVYGLRGNLYQLSLPQDEWQKIETSTTSSLLGGEVSVSGDIVISGLAGAYVYKLAKSEKFVTSSFKDRYGNQGVIELANRRYLFYGEHGARIVGGLE